MTNYTLDVGWGQQPHFEAIAAGKDPMLALPDEYSVGDTVTFEFEDSTVVTRVEEIRESDLGHKYVDVILEGVTGESKSFNIAVLVSNITGRRVFEVKPSEYRTMSETIASGHGLVKIPLANGIWDINVQHIVGLKRLDDE